MKNIFSTANNRGIFANRAFALILMGLLISAVIFSLSSGIAHADSAPLPGETFANDREKDIEPVERVYEINSPEGKALVKLDPLKEPYAAEIDNGTRISVGHIYTDPDSGEQWGFFFIDSESGKLPDGMRYNNTDDGELTLSWGGSVSGWVPISDMKLIAEDGKEVPPKEAREPGAATEGAIDGADETDESASSLGITGGADGPVSITLGSNIQLVINVLILIIIALAVTLIIVLVIMRKMRKAIDKEQEQK